MAITQVNTIGGLEPAFSIDGNNLTAVLDSTNKAMCSMRYVTDIYLNGGATATARVKLSPNTTNGLCTVSINRILEDFVSFDRVPHLRGFTGATNSLSSYRLAFGEETDGTFGCTGASFSVNMGSLGSTKYVFNGTLQYNEAFVQVDWLVQDASPGTKRFLTNAPQLQYAQTSEESYLYFLHNIGATTTPTVLQIDVVGSTGATTHYEMLLGIPTSVVDMGAVGVGATNINAAAAIGLVTLSGASALGPIVSCNQTYTVSLGVGSISWTEKRSYFTSCDCDRFTPYRFAWLNRRGGFDTYTFRLKSTRTVSTKTFEYARFLSRLNFASNDFGYTFGDRGRTVYNLDSMDLYTVVSTWQSDEIHSWLAELFTSPAVYLVSDDGWDPIIVTTNSVEIKNKNGYGNRLLSHTIEFAKAYATTIQRS